MYDEYIELYNIYTQKYGSKTAIFLMVGSFYELYDIINTETGETKCNVKEIFFYIIKSSFIFFISFKVFSFIQ